MSADIGKHGLLIGMDIMGSGDFSVCGDRFFSYCLPSFDTPVDFVKRAESENQKNR